MVIFKCKMCGGTIEFEEGATVGVCDSCGTKQTLPRLDDEKKANLYDRANHFRRNNEFDKASLIYEQILNEDTTDSEAYWSLVLCNYGIEYVEDPATHKRVPTVNRAQFTSIFEDDNYKSAIKYADSVQRELYENEAKIINNIQKDILLISQKEEPFDVFICYKETDNYGRRTPDSVLANDLYYLLVQEGFKVFFARITLEDKLGSAYEPYIFAALQSSKVMVVLGTKPEYFNAVWVKNEWSRYLSLVKKSGGKKILIPAYKDMDPYDLPDEFSHLQAQDMSKLGFMQDLIRGIKKLVKADAERSAVNETVITATGSKSVVPLLERMFLFLEDGKWQDADIYCEKVLDMDPKNAYAYLGKLMVELQLRSRKELADLPESFENNENYAKVIRFADEKLEEEIRGYIEHINERNENTRLSNLYEKAVGEMNRAYNDNDYELASEIFKSISGFKDADALSEECIEKAKIFRNDSIYGMAKWYLNREYLDERDYELALIQFKKIPGYKDSDEQIDICERKIDEIKECKRIKAEEFRIHDEKVKRIIKKMLIVISLIIVCYIVIQAIHKKVISPIAKYNKALHLTEIGNYKEAYELLKGLNYKDSTNKMSEIKSQYIKEALFKSQVGSYVYFGTYEQDNKADIKWVVLEKQDDRILLLSQYVIQNHTYNERSVEITWETSDIRKWLNSVYINTIFNIEEQNLILETDVVNNNNVLYGTYGGSNTKDKLFLLSIDEVNKYFNSDSQRKATWRFGGPHFWWLRSPGVNPHSAASINEYGDLREQGNDVFYTGGIRPAFWIKN